MLESRTVLYLLCSFIGAGGAGGGEWGGGAGILRFVCSGWNEIGWSCWSCGLHVGIRCVRGHEVFVRYFCMGLQLLSKSPAGSRSDHTN